MNTSTSGLATFPIPLGIPTSLIALWSSRIMTTTVEVPVESAPVETVEPQATKFETAAVATVVIDGEQNDLLDALTREVSDSPPPNESSIKTPPVFFKNAVKRSKNRHPK